MKKLINDPKRTVVEQLEGMALAYPDLVAVHLEPNVVRRVDAPVEGKVAVISGGGSGHEPMHSGLVGPGMLDAACPGDVFASPSVEQILAAGKVTNGGAGVLFIVGNYAGDLRSFEKAADMARAEDIDALNILIDDDVAVEDSLYSAGRRGAGTLVLAGKIVGAAAERGYSLEELADLCRKVNTHGRSMAVALTPCIVPTAGEPTFRLDEDEMEIGIGIHGEPGRERLPLRTADEIAEMLALSIIEDEAYVRTVREWDIEEGAWGETELVDPPLEEGDDVLAFVNSLGGTPDGELLIIYRKLQEVCQERGLRIVRNLIGRYLTSLEMQGVSITLLKMDAELIDLWDDPVLTPSLRWKM